MPVLLPHLSMSWSLSSAVTGRNIIHASDGPESAKAEITNWFAPSEVVEWTPSTATWVYEGK